MFCQKCGKQINDNATFCPYCEMTLQTDNYGKIPEGIGGLDDVNGNRKKRPPYMLAIISVAVGVFLPSIFNILFIFLGLPGHAFPALGGVVGGVIALIGIIQNILHLKQRTNEQENKIGIICCSFALLVCIFICRS